MGSYKIGLDFGTHQTKVCIEEISDKRNKRYIFHSFLDLEGKKHWTFPSFVQVNEDNTLSYGFTDRDNMYVLEHAPGEPPKMPEEPNYWQYKRFDPIVKPKEPMPLVEDNRSDKMIIANDFASLQQLIEKRNEVEREIIRRKKNEKIEKMRYESEIRSYNKACLKREQEIAKDKEDVDRVNEALRKIYEKDLKKYEYQCNEYNTPYPFIFENFKQAIFSTGIKWPYENITPEKVAVWYLSFIFFDIGEEYGKDIVVCMGTSSGRREWQKNKQRATQIMLAVYDLVENVCKNDKQYFLSLTIYELISHTNIRPFSQKEKEDNSIFVFPEAFANINPLAQQRRFGTGINAIIDIGGGTTDISVFSAYEKAESEKAGEICVEIYDYISIPYGVNAIEEHGKGVHFQKVKECIHQITDQLQNYAKSIGVSPSECKSITSSRPVVFSGGGSLRRELCKKYGGFSDIIYITSDMVSDTSIDDISELSDSIAMLNTALGLAKCKDDDSEIPLQSYDRLFSKVKEAYKDRCRKERINLHYEYGLLDD